MISGSFNLILIYAENQFFGYLRYFTALSSLNFKFALFDITLWYNYTDLVIFSNYKMKIRVTQVSVLPAILFNLTFQVRKSNWGGKTP